MIFQGKNMLHRFVPAVSAIDTLEIPDMIKIKDMTDSIRVPIFPMYITLACFVDGKYIALKVSQLKTEQFCRNKATKKRTEAILLKINSL